MAEKGKAWENQIARWFKKEEIYYERFFDSRSVGGMSSQRPADFFTYYNDTLVYHECKSSEKKSMSIKRLYQIPRLLKVRRYGIESFFLLKFKDGMIAIDTKKLYSAITHLHLRSVNMDVLEPFGVILKKSKQLKDLLE